MTMLQRLSYYRLPVFQAPDAPTTPSSAPSSTTPSAPASSADVSGASPASTPASTPETPSSPTPASTEAGTGVDFDLFFGDSPDERTEPSPAPGPSPSEPPKAEETPPKAPAQVAPAGTEAPKPAATPETATSAPTEPSQAAAPELDPYDPGALANHLNQNEAQVVQHLAENQFKLSAEDIEALESNTAAFVPTLLARTFVKAQQNMLMQMGRLMPVMMQKQTQMLQRNTENETKFYSRWPDIKKDQHGDLVRQYAVVYRQMNPTKTLQEMIEAVGPMVMMSANITPSAPGAPPKAASPMAPAGNGRPQPSPFTPAAAVAGGASPTTAPQLAPYEAMFVGNPDE